jgi:hypothetical protein
VLEQAISTCKLTKGKINFTDQSVNSKIALESSASRSFATIDLKDASDCLSLKLFRFLFGGASKFFESCRATDIKLLDGRVHQLRKYAPMGNATVFPVESLVFWAVVRSGILCYYGETCDDVYVFGDDIAVPTKFYDGAIKALVRAGFKPNPNKCFSRGLFRESCGVDAFNGIDVTPHRIKKHGMKSLSQLVSACSLAKNMRMDGYEETASLLYYEVSKVAGKLHLSNNPDAQGIYEYVKRDIGYLLRYEPSFRWNGKFQRWETKIVQVQPVLSRLERHDWYHVMDSLLRIQSKGDLITERGLSYPVPHRTRRSCGWTPVLWADGITTSTRIGMQLIRMSSPEVFTDFDERHAAG